MSDNIITTGRFTKATTISDFTKAKNFEVKLFAGDYEIATTQGFSGDYVEAMKMFNDIIANKPTGEILDALKAAVELSDWIAEKISKLEYEDYLIEDRHKEGKLNETKIWEELTDSMRDGLMASYHEQFREALNSSPKEK